MDLTRTERDSSAKGLQDLENPTWPVFDDKGLWKCGGKLHNANIPCSAKHPIFIPRTHYLATLLVQDPHSCVHHNGVRETLTEVRSKYWII